MGTASQDSRPRGKASWASVHPERRVAHLAAGIVFPTAALIFPLWWVQVGAVAATIAFIGAEAGRFIYPPLNGWFRRFLGRVLKEEESEVRITGAAYMLLVTVICLFAFRESVAVAALYFLAVGDPAASTFGRRFGRWRIGVKTLEGTFAFFGASLAVGLLLYGVGRLPLVAMAAGGAAAAALAELLPLPADDNLWSPLAGGLAMTAIALLLPG